MVRKKNTMTCKCFPSKIIKQILHRLRRLMSMAPRAPQTSPCPPHKKYEDTFRRFDADGDGKISTQELHSLFTWSGDNVTYKQVERVMKDVIGNNEEEDDGLMDYEDFLKLMEMGRSEGNEEDDLRKAFEMFEVDKGSGCITPSGLQQILNKLGEVRSYEECVLMISAYDLDGNGVLDYQEFRRMMMA